MSLLTQASICITPNGYKEGTLYSVIPSDGSGDMSVVRATTATRVNSAGLVESVANNIPRLDYSNGTCPSLLVEPQRTNLLPNSSMFSNWLSAGGTVTDNTTIAPDGTMTADTLTGLRYQVGLGANVFTFSCYAKLNGGAGNFWIRVDAPSTFQTVFDLNNGTFSAPSGYTATIQDVGNGWFRCTMTTPNITLVNAVIVSSDYGANSTYVWGAQLEAGSYPTSYIPTTSASVTRNADVVSKTGISSLIGQTEGTIFIEEIYDATIQNNGGLDDTLISLTDGSANNLISIFHYGSNVGVAQKVVFFIRLSGSTQVSIASSALPSGTYKIALAYKNNDVVGYINGVQIGTDTSASIPTTSVVTFVDPITTNAATKTVKIKASALWKTRLTNTQLAQLTTI
jgi:hypothetical protein